MNYNERAKQLVALQLKTLPAGAVSGEAFQRIVRMVAVLLEEGRR